VSVEAVTHSLTEVLSLQIPNIHKRRAFGPSKTKAIDTSTLVGSLVVLNKFASTHFYQVYYTYLGSTFPNRFNPIRQ
jgi:hypothetical protein